MVRRKIRCEHAQRIARGRISRKVSSQTDDSSNNKYSDLIVLVPGTVTHCFLKLYFVRTIVSSKANNPIVTMIMRGTIAI